MTPDPDAGSQARISPLLSGIGRPALIVAIISAMGQGVDSHVYALAVDQAGTVYVSMGEVDKGLALIEQGIAKGGLKRPEDAKLRLGLAQQQSAKARSKATQTLKSVQGSDGSADIARLWILLGNG